QNNARSFFIRIPEILLVELKPNERKNAAPVGNHGLVNGAPPRPHPPGGQYLPHHSLAPSGFGLGYFFYDPPVFVPSREIVERIADGFYAPLFEERRYPRPHPFYELDRRRERVAALFFRHCWRAVFRRLGHILLLGFVSTGRYSSGIPE